jgi:hypothetical protein
MRKIIDGIRYDTESARLVGLAASRTKRTDSRWWSEALYVGQRSGRFFLHGSGGPLSQWGRTREDNTRENGEGIHPVTAEQALAWAENCLPADGPWVEHFKAAITDA